MTPQKKRCEVDSVFYLLKDGFSKKEIQKKLDIKPSSLSNHLRRLEESNNIKRVGKYKIDILSSSYLNPKVTKNKLHKGFNKRGHAHNSTIHFHKKTILHELPKIKTDEKAGVFTKLKFGSLKFVRDGFTIWINKNNLTIYSNNSYYSGNALNSKFAALRNIDNLIQNLISKYDLPKYYGIEIFREHYGLIFNKFAKWLNKQGRKMYVEDKRGKSILWVDKSRKDDVGLEEFEGEDPMKINKADGFFESKDRTGWKDDTPQVEDNSKKIKDHDKVLDKSMEVLEGYAKQISLHLKVEEGQLKTQKETQRILALMEESLKETKKRLSKDGDLK